jgi:hypothetical protein
VRLNTLLLIVGVWICAGCDAMVHTHFSITPAMTGRVNRPDDVLLAVRSVVEARGLEELRSTNMPPTSRITFTDWYPGKNPNLFVTVSYEQWPVNINLTERWTSHRSRKHRKLARELEVALEDRELQVTKQ